MKKDREGSGGEPPDELKARRIAKLDADSLGTTAMSDNEKLELGASIRAEKIKELKHNLRSRFDRTITDEEADFILIRLLEGTENDVAELDKQFPECSKYFRAIIANIKKHRA